MAISVVLSQSPRRSSERQALEEDLVTGLLMEDGLEVNVIPHLEQLQPGDTGLLCLEGITAHVVLLSWLSPLASYQAARRLGVPGRFGRSCQARVTPPEVADADHPRSIYALELAQFADAEACREEILRIQKELSQQVFSIGSLDSPSVPRVERPRVERPQPAAAPPAPPSIDSGGEGHQELDDDRLEELVDELDRLDI